MACRDGAINRSALPPDIIQRALGFPQRNLNVGQSAPLHFPRFAVLFPHRDIRACLAEQIKGTMQTTAAVDVGVFVGMPRRALAVFDRRDLQFADCAVNFLDRDILMGPYVGVAPTMFQAEARVAKVGQRMHIARVLGPGRQGQHDCQN